MNAIVQTTKLSRRAMIAGGALTIGFAMAGVPKRARAQFAGAAPRVLDPKIGRAHV